MDDYCAVLIQGLSRNQFDVFEILLIQPAGKFEAGISQTKSTAVPQEWYRFKSQNGE